MSDHDDLIGDYLDEGRAYLDFLNDRFLTIEADPSIVDADPEIINETFRAAHSLKGLTAAFGFERANAVIHRMENILDGVRQKELTLNPGLIVVLYKALDVLASLTDEVASGEGEQSDTSVVLDAIEAALAAGTIESTDNLSLNRQQPRAEVATTEVEVPDGGAKKLAKTLAANETIRVGMDRLDRLMNLTGELVIARSRILNLSETVKELPSRDPATGNGMVAIEEFDKLSATLIDAIGDLEGVTNGIQNTVMEVRMVSLEPVFRRFQRTVRDVANQLGKRIQLVLEGTDTELDKRVADEIVNPLTHIVRNAADHGLERPEVRQEAGKPDVGVITLRAYQGGNHVVIEVVDDGAGMDPERLKTHGMNKGVLSAEEAEKMTDEEAYLLIFRPGFSTAEAVTDISGRGMGMDIVVSTIEGMKGSIAIESTFGQGSKFSIRLPLTLSILTCLLVRANGEILAIPLTNISELVTVDETDTNSVMDHEVVMVRNEPVPLVDLREHFAFHTVVEAPEQTRERPVVVIQTGTSALGLVVDELLRKDDLVVKPLDRDMDILGISGSAILGDGRVALILDPGNIAPVAEAAPAGV